MKRPTKCSERANLTITVGSLIGRHLRPVDADSVRADVERLRLELVRLGLDTIDRCRVIAPKRVDAA